MIVSLFCLETIRVNIQSPSILYQAGCAGFREYFSRLHLFFDLSSSQFLKEKKSLRDLLF